VHPAERAKAKAAESAPYLFMEILLLECSIPSPPVLITGRSSYNNALAFSRVRIPAREDGAFAIVIPL
jgi:hypothetical protein